MLISNKISNYLLNEKIGGFSNLYVCNKSYCYLKYNTHAKSVIKGKYSLSSTLKSTIKVVEKYLMLNNEYFDLLLDENTDNYKGICIIKLNENRYAIFTSKTFFSNDDYKNQLRIASNIKKFIIR